MTSSKVHSEKVAGDEILFNDLENLLYSSKLENYFIEIEAIVDRAFANTEELIQELPADYLAQFSKFEEFDIVSKRYNNQFNSLNSQFLEKWKSKMQSANQNFQELLKRYVEEKNENYDKNAQLLKSRMWTIILIFIVL